MKRRFFACVLFVFCSLIVETCFSQSYSRFYSDNYIIAKIEKQEYKGNCGVYPEHLYIRLKGNTPVIVSGYIKIRFTVCNSGEEYYTEKYFSERVPERGKLEVNDYYNPKYFHGNYETIGFYIDEITPTDSEYARSEYGRGYYTVAADFAYVYKLNVLGEWLPPKEGYPKGTKIYVYGTLASNPQLAIVAISKWIGGDTYMRMCDLVKE